MSTWQERARAQAQAELTAEETRWAQAHQAYMDRLAAKVAAVLKLTPAEAARIARDDARNVVRLDGVAFRLEHHDTEFRLEFGRDDAWNPATLAAIGRFLLVRDGPPEDTA